MLIENEFTVHAPADDVYRLMLDVERVAPCIPGTRGAGPAARTAATTPRCR